MQIIVTWDAKRAGAYITIEGCRKSDGSKIKITGVTKIEGTATGPIAHVKDGALYKLL